MFFYVCCPTNSIIISKPRRRKRPTQILFFESQGDSINYNTATSNRFFFLTRQAPQIPCHHKFSHLMRQCTKKGELSLMSIAGVITQPLLLCVLQLQLAITTNVKAPQTVFHPPKLRSQFEVVLPDFNRTRIPIPLQVPNWEENEPCN